MAQEITKPTPSATQAADPFERMRREMDRVLDSFLGGTSRWPLSLGEAGPAMLSPRIDVKENGSEIRIEAELPGIEEKDVQVTLRDGVLTIRGKKKSERTEEKADYHLSERSYGSFHRAFQLGDVADEEKVTASFDKGVLRIKVPKRAEVQKAEKRIPIGKG